MEVDIEKNIGWSRSGYRKIVLICTAVSGSALVVSFCKDIYL